MYTYFFFFFQAEDGIRDADVTGVQTCALPIYKWQEKRLQFAELKEAKLALKKAKEEMEQAESNYDLNRAAELKYNTIVKLETQIQELEVNVKVTAEAVELRQEANDETIALEVSRWTGL